MTDSFPQPALEADPAAKRAYIKTYGCQMNVYDSERMAETLAGQGYSLTDNPADADLAILNTCHIREKAAEKVYSDVGRLRDLEATRQAAGRETLIAVAGCVAQAEGAEIARRAPAVNLVFGPQTYHRLPSLLNQAREAAAAGRRVRVIDAEFPAEDKFDHLPSARTARSPTAFLTVQEGCDKFCSFCVVPYTRGAEVSRPLAGIVAEAQALVAKGVRELTLLGQNVNAYHSGDHDLAGLIRALAAIDGLARIRFTTSHPRDMTDSLIALFGEEPKLMPYLHLPVQSGSDRILAAMNRQHRTDTYLATLEKVRRVRPDIALSGDFIVGFPDETEEDFQATLALVDAVGYAQAYSFKYSPRPGTPAAGLTNQVAEAVKAERLERLQSWLGVHQRAFNAASVGQRMTVLLERVGREPHQLIGRSPYLQSVHVKTQTAHLGDLVEVDILSAGQNSLEGAIVTQKG